MMGKLIFIVEGVWWEREEQEEEEKKKTTQEWPKSLRGPQRLFMYALTGQLSDGIHEKDFIGTISLILRTL